jgi:hypothetical protein
MKLFGPSDECVAKAAMLLKTDPSQMTMYSWPITFGSSCGPNGGMGGQAITSFQCYVFEGNNACVAFCGNKIRMVKSFRVGQAWEDFKPPLRITNDKV